MKTIDIPLRLRVARERAELTQKEAARLAHLDKGSVSSWEVGSRDPKVSHLVKLLAVYQVHVSRFFSDGFLETEDWR